MLSRRRPAPASVAGLLALAVVLPVMACSHGTDAGQAAAAAPSAARASAIRTTQEPAPASPAATASRPPTSKPSRPAPGTATASSASAAPTVKDSVPASDSPSPSASRSTAMAPATTYPEEAYNRHGVPTFENYSSVSGPGPDLGFTQVVQVSCKVYDPSIPSVSPDGYWYRIASAPWDNRYYAAANTFLNGLLPSNPNTNYYDPRVPNC